MFYLHELMSNVQIEQFDDTLFADWAIEHQEYFIYLMFMFFFSLSLFFSMELLMVIIKIGFCSSNQEDYSLLIIVTQYSQ